MKTKKGFTLIELLAVIVILAIIALITVPMIVGVIEKARKGAFLDSAYGVLDTLKLEYINKAASNDTKGNFVYTFPSSGLKISGKEPGGGRANMDTNGKVELAIWDDDKKWCATKADNEETITLVDYVEGACKIAEPIFKRTFYLTGGFSRPDFTTIEFVKTREVPEDALKSWDASEVGNGSVMAWVYKDKEDQTKYNLYIGGNGVVYAPLDSSSLFDADSSSGYVNLEKLDVTYLNTNKVTDMSSMFRKCNKIVDLDIGHFDTSHVTNMSEMFSNCSQVRNLKVESFDTSKVTDMSSMFSRCSNVESLDVSHFDTSHVTNISEMFSAAVKLTSLDVSGFDTSSVTDMSSFVSSCTALTTLDLSRFNTSKVTDMEAMFYNCQRLQNLDISNFNTSNVVYFRAMFGNCFSIGALDLSHFDTSKGIVLSDFFSNCRKLKNLNIRNFSFENTTNYGGFFYTMPADATIIVGSATLQNFLLTTNGMDRPSSWTSASVVIG